MRPETKALYPDNWPQISQEYIDSCNRICRDCGRSDRTDPIILTTHHKDYDPSNNSRDNFACLCQGCHLRLQGKEFSQAIKYHRVDMLIRMGQMCFPGLEPIPPKNMPPAASTRV